MFLSEPVFLHYILYYLPNVKNYLVRVSSSWGEVPTKKPVGWLKTYTKKSQSCLVSNQNQHNLSLFDAKTVSYILLCSRTDDLNTYVLKRFSILNSFKTIEHFEFEKMIRYDILVVLYVRYIFEIIAVLDNFFRKRTHWHSTDMYHIYILR